MSPHTKPKVWIEEGDEVHRYNDHYCVRLWVRIPFVDTFPVDLKPSTCRKLARSLDIAAELADARREE